MLKKSVLTLIALFCITNYSLAITDNPEEKPFSKAEDIAKEHLDQETDRKYDEAVLIKEIQVEGNHLVSEDEIKDAVLIKPGEELDRQKIRASLKSVYKMGYFSDKMKAVLKPTGEGVILKIVLQENAPITGFNIEGNDSVDTTEILERLNGNIGMPQNINNLNIAIAQIERLYESKGYILARVTQISDDPDGIINIDINEGTIEDIKISGNKKTKDFVIRRNILIKPGSVYNENALKADLQRIYGTQAFEDVRRVIEPSDKDPNKYILTIEVDEKRSGSITIGGGLDTATGLFGSGGYTDHNFRGLGQEIGINFTGGSGLMFQDADIIKRASYQIEARFLEPRFRQTTNALQARVYGRDFASWQVPLAIEKYLGGEVEITHPFAKVPHLAGGIALGVEGVSIEEGDDFTMRQKFQQAGVDFSKREEMLTSGTFLTLGPRLVYDTRDSFINPRSGMYASLGLKEYLSFNTTDSFGRVDAVIKQYYPVGKKSSFSLMAKAGGNLHGDMPLFAGYSLGGMRSMRGYRQGEAGRGLGLVMGTAEFRTPIPFMDRITKNKFFNDIRIAAFADAGRIFQESPINDVYDYPGYGISVGAGLRINIPGLGPVKLDWGYPLTSVGAGRDQKIRFLFDIGEMY